MSVTGHNRLSDEEDDDVSEEEVAPIPEPKSFIQRGQLWLDENIEKIDFYATVFFSLVAIGAFFGFLFLVPFVIEPAVTTIQMDFDVNPVTCCVVSFTEDFGAKNCSRWSSCREGCTRSVFECFKIVVAYTDAENFSCSERPPNHQWLHNEANLYPNVKGCGYPPSLNCTVFANKYRRTNTTFPCHYSRVDATLVITSLDPDTIEHNLMVSIVVPVVAFLVSTVYLTHAYHRMKRKEATAAELDLKEKAQCLLDKEDDDKEVTRSNATSTYSIKSISSKVGATLVRLARDRRRESGSDHTEKGDVLEMDEVVERRPPSRYLKPGRMPSGNRHNLLEPLPSPPAPAALPGAPGAPGAPAAGAPGGKDVMSPVET